jgi:hypothetical protein
MRMSSRVQLCEREREGDEKSERGRDSGSTSRRPDGTRSSSDRPLRSTSRTSESVARAHRERAPLAAARSLAVQNSRNPLASGLNRGSQRHRVDSTRQGTRSDQRLSDCNRVQRRDGAPSPAAVVLSAHVLGVSCSAVGSTAAAATAAAATSAVDQRGCRLRPVRSRLWTPSPWLARRPRIKQQQQQLWRRTGSRRRSVLGLARSQHARISRRRGRNWSRRCRGRFGWAGRREEETDPRGEGVLALQEAQGQPQPLSLSRARAPKRY